MGPHPHIKSNVPLPEHNYRQSLQERLILTQGNTTTCPDERGRWDFTNSSGLHVSSLYSRPAVLINSLPQHRPWIACCPITPRLHRILALAYAWLNGPARHTRSAGPSRLSWSIHICMRIISRYGSDIQHQDACRQNQALCIYVGADNFETYMKRVVYGACLTGGWIKTLHTKTGLPIGILQDTGLHTNTGSGCMLHACDWPESAVIHTQGTVIDQKLTRLTCIPVCLVHQDGILPAVR